eukprot:11867405-Karenia_brevis.AAC.1
MPSDGSAHKLRLASLSRRFGRLHPRYLCLPSKYPGGASGLFVCDTSFSLNCRSETTAET